MTRSGQERLSGGNRSVEIRVRGLVQGVGFRPHVWRLANELALIGDVSNDHAGVLIHCAGPSATIDTFVHRLEADSPAHARIDSIDIREAARVCTAVTFDIIASASRGAAAALAPDMATCEDCLAEITDPQQRRHAYAFTNCTHCGPRLTIIERAPYDRGNTSMRAFAMCEDCQKEYFDPTDRRFHAQPIACLRCGPRLAFGPIDNSSHAASAANDPISAAAGMLTAGGIVAIKGLGGFHLACDATNAAAVTRLRARKRRFGKAFAVMMRDLDTVRRYCEVSETEAAMLRSREAPIVLLEANGPERLPDAVAPGLATLGVLLPYTPLHHMLLARCGGPLLMTSGNISDEPQCIDNTEARQRLAAIADHQLDHDRRIVNRLDDSVLRVMAGRPAVLRRARGYAPASLRLPDGFAGAPPVLAMGGELKSTFCFLDKGRAVLSQHLGDLENAPTFDDYRKTLDLYLQLFAHAPRFCAIDLHPDYLSRKLGEAMAEARGWQVVEIQHHHAHVAACLAENGVALDAPPVLGIALDGLGYGENGAIWGGELLLANYRGYRRVASLRPVAMPGGAAAIREPWRNTLAQILATMSWAEFETLARDTRLHAYLSAKPVATIASMIRSGVNSPLASSAGRLFDAVAGALGIAADGQNHEGEAAARLESLAGLIACGTLGENEAYSFGQSTLTPEGLRLIETAELWPALLADLAAGVSAPVISGRFHKGFAICVRNLVVLLLDTAPNAMSKTVALSGGCFQNKLLLEGVKNRLENYGIRVLCHAIVPASDGGLALGQAVIAAARGIR